MSRQEKLRAISDAWFEARARGDEFAQEQLAAAAAAVNDGYLFDLED